MKLRIVIFSYSHIIIFSSSSVKRIIATEQTKMQLLRSTNEQNSETGISRRHYIVAHCTPGYHISSVFRNINGAIIASERIAFVRSSITAVLVSVMQFHKACIIIFYFIFLSICSLVFHFFSFIFSII